MTVDLYQSYKKFYQRWYRNKTSPIRSSMKDLAHDLVKYIYDNRNEKNQSLVRDTALEMADVLLHLEVKSRFENLVSPEIIEALSNERFIVDVPYPVARRWNTEFITGYVYVMTSKEMPGLSKLGATMMDLNVRINKYRNRYGYEVSLFFAKEFLGPFSVEKKIGELILNFRLHGKNEYHTNEWYEIEPTKLRKLIEDYVVSR